MNCREITNKLVSFQERSLSASEKKEIEEHLKKCPGCHRHQIELDATWDMLSQVESFSSAPFFWTRLSQRMAEREKAARKIFLNPLPWLGSPAITMVILIVALLTGFYFGKTIFDQTTLSSPTKSEQESYEANSLNELDSYRGESISEAYVSLISENSN